MTLPDREVGLKKVYCRIVLVLIQLGIQMCDFIISKFGKGTKCCQQKSVRMLVYYVIAIIVFSDFYHLKVSDLN